MRMSKEDREEQGDQVRTQDEADSRSNTDSNSDAMAERMTNALFRVSCPLAITVSLAYSVYLGWNSGGSDIVDDEICRTISDSAIPYSGNDAKEIAFLVFDRIANFSIHYYCAFVAIVHCFFSGEQGGVFAYNVKFPFVPFGFYISMGLIIGFVQTYVDEVYCSDNIWIDMAMINAGFLVSHVVLYLIRSWLDDEEETNPVDDDNDKAICSCEVEHGPPAKRISHVDTAGLDTLQLTHKDYSPPSSSPANSS